MSGKGIADLRAKFENRTGDTSPPSRGRSPAGQDNALGGEKRKVRTSFISVEKSGQLGSSVDQRESIGSQEDQIDLMDATTRSSAEVNGEAEKMPPMTGLAIASEVREEQHEPKGQPAGSPQASKASNGTLAPDEAGTEDAVSPDKPATADEEEAPSMQPSDPKDEGAVSGGAALAPKGESLGTLLKGSEFETEKEESIKYSSPKNKGRGQPNAGDSPRSKSGTPRSSPRKEPIVSPPGNSAESKARINGDTTNSVKTPTSPTSTKSPFDKGPAQPTAMEPKKAATQRPTRPSNGTKSIATASGKSTKPSGGTDVLKKPKATSPTTAKPKPRSPTRPVRLPGAATASTTASAAKTGVTAPPQPSTRTSLSNSVKPSTANKPTAAKAPTKPAQSTAASLRNKAPRSSLPASTTASKPKPQPRTSTASTTAANGDFLARMMRPTQSSANKTHEKVEQMTPPKKRVSARPKRISDEDGKETKSTTEQEQSGAAQEEPAQQAQVQEAEESSHLESTNDLTDVAQQEIKETSDAEPISGA